MKTFTLKVLAFKLAMLLTLGAVLFSVVACSKNDRNKYVEVWHSLSGTGQQAVQEIIADYNKVLEQNGEVIRVKEFKYASGTVLEQSITNGVAEGVGPDVVFHFPTFADNFLQDDFLLDMSPYFDMDKLKEEIEPSAYNDATGYRKQGLYSVGLYASGPVIYFNEKLMDSYVEQGIPKPDSENLTWQQIEEYSALVSQKLDKPGFGYSNPMDFALFLMLQNGSDMISADRKSADFGDNDKAAKQAFEYIKRNVNNGNFQQPPTAAGEYMSDYFKNSEFPIFLGGTSDYAFFPSGTDANGNPTPGLNLEEIAVMPIAGSQGFDSADSDNANRFQLWNRSAFAFKSEENRERVTSEFVKFLTNAENSAKLSIGMGNASPYRQNILKDNQAYQEFLQSVRGKPTAVMSSVMENAYLPPPLSGVEIMRKQIEKAIKEWINPNANRDLQTILNDARDEINRELNRG
ncbi:MAG: extracellular solute-binding protein [Clostridiales bacterium]|jgi:hypothetical protein|nr:extracellular solute-binding protein [Clostridiales bacterium]